jgi:hypothetical protein
MFHVKHVDYFPMQNEEKIMSRISSGVVSPVTSPIAARLSRRSIASSYPEVPAVN